MDLDSIFVVKSMGLSFIRKEFGPRVQKFVWNMFAGPKNQGFFRNIYSAQGCRSFSET